MTITNTKIIWRSLVAILAVFSIVQTVRLNGTSNSFETFAESKQNEIEFLRDTTCYDHREEIARIKSEHTYLIDSLEDLYAEKWRIEYRSKWKPNEIEDTLQQENLDVIKEKEQEIRQLESQSWSLREKIAKCDQPIDEQDAEAATWWASDNDVNERLLTE